MKHLILGVLAAFAVLLISGPVRWLVNLLAAQAPLVVLVVCLPATLAIFWKLLLDEPQR